MSFYRFQFFLLPLINNNILVLHLNWRADFLLDCSALLSSEQPLYRIVLYWMERIKSIYMSPAEWIRQADPFHWPQSQRWN